jgi:hypothetical protein
VLLGFLVGDIGLAHLQALEGPHQAHQHFALLAAGGQEAGHQVGREIPGAHAAHVVGQLGGPGLVNLHHLVQHGQVLGVIGQRTQLLLHRGAALQAFAHRVQVGTHRVVVQGGQRAVGGMLVGQQQLRTALQRAFGHGIGQQDALQRLVVQIAQAVACGQQSKPTHANHGNQ